MFAWTTGIFGCGILTVAAGLAADNVFTAAVVRVVAIAVIAIAVIAIAVVVAATIVTCGIAATISAKPIHK